MMVHTFKCLGREFAFDTESGSAFEIDSAAKLIINGINNSSFGANGDRKDFLLSEIVASLTESKTTAVDIEEALTEITTLINEGVLFSPAPKLQLPKHNGEVKALCLNISHHCNLKCAYCFAGGGSYNLTAAHMSINEAKAAVDFLIAKSGARKNLEIDFFGGEPLLNFDVVKETVDYARAQEKKTGKVFRFTVTTNGLNLTDDIIDYLNEEMYNVVISIDGREDVHNAVRPDTGGGESFKKILSNALRFRKKRKQRQYYIRGTFTAKNKDFAADVLALADCGFDQVSLEPVVLPPSHPLALCEADLPVLCKQYEILAEEYLRRRGTDKAFEFFHFNIDLKGGPCLKKRLTGCGVGGEYLCVSPGGGIYPCHRFDGIKEYRMGSVADKASPSKASELCLKTINFFQKSSLLTKEHCKDCFAKYLCSGGCAANNIEYGGGIDSAHLISCELMKKRAECAIAIGCVLS